MKCFKCCKPRSNGTPLLQNVTITFCVCFTEQRDNNNVRTQPDSSTVNQTTTNQVPSPDLVPNVSDNHEEILSYKKSNYCGRFSWKKYREIYV